MTQCRGSLTGADAGDSPYEDAFDNGGIVFDPPSSAFEGELEVAMSVVDSIDGSIHYTLDGTLPTESSPVYDAPIAVARTTEIQAAVFVDGLPERFGSAVYIPKTTDIEIDLPIIVLDDFGAGEPDRDHVRAVVMVFDVHDGVASTTRTPEVAAGAGFHLRGQSTAGFDKKPYRLEFRDGRGYDRDISVLGMPAESDWVLRGPFVDKSLIRDAFHYSLGADIGMASPRFAFCELYKNLDGGELDESDYEGVYLIVETIKNQKDRLDLKQLTSADTSLPAISGGYIFKFEWKAAEAPILDCPSAASTGPWGDQADGNCWRDLEVVDPIDMNSSQQAWLAKHLYEFSESLHSSSLDDPDGYGRYIDAQSFMDQIILNEIGREADAYIRSAYFYKDRDEVIFAGPLWDYNFTLGVGFDLMGLENLDTDGWMYEMNRTRDNPSNDWFFTMVDDPSFHAQLVARWKSLRSGPLSDASLDERIDSLAESISSGASRNFHRWSNLGEQNIDVFRSPATTTWDEQITLLEQWLRERLAWMDSQWR